MKALRLLLVLVASLIGLNSQAAVSVIGGGSGGSGIFTNSYHFDPSQFNVAAVTNVSIKSTANVTNLTNNGRSTFTFVTTNRIAVFNDQNLTNGSISEASIINTNTTLGGALAGLLPNPQLAPGDSATNFLIYGGTITNTAITNAMATVSTPASYDSKGRLTNLVVASSLDFTGNSLSIATIVTAGQASVVNFNNKGQITSTNALTAGMVPAIPESGVINLVSDLAALQQGSQNLTNFSSVPTNYFVVSTNGTGNGLSLTNTTLFQSVRRTLTYGSGGTNVLIDLSTGNSFKLLLTANANIIFTNIINTNYEETANIHFRQDGTGGWAVNFSNTNAIFSGGVVPTITTNAGAISTLSVISCPWTNGQVQIFYGLDMK